MQLIDQNASTRRKIRVACLGHDTYFENHYCEKSATNFLVGWFSFDHFSSDFYRDIVNFRPDITLIFRPEMHHKSDIALIPGIKIGFSSEPMPKIVNGIVQKSTETDRRVGIFTRMDFTAYDAVYHYDQNSKDYAEQMGWPFAGYRELPVNTDFFHPFDKPEPYWDLVFVGKATPRRSDLVSALKSYNIQFLWIEHGVSGRELADIFRRSKCILNIHADELVALEPRIYLAAACGVPVLSDDYGHSQFPMSSFVQVIDMTKLRPAFIEKSVDAVKRRINMIPDTDIASQVVQLSAESFVRDVISRYA